MKKMEKTWQACGLCHLHHGAVHDCHQCCRGCKKKLTASLLRTPKTAEFEERHVPALHHPLHQHGQCVLMTEREPTCMRGPPLHCQQCHPNNFAPSHLSLPQNMAVEMKVMKIWTIYFQTVLGKEGVFEYYKIRPLFLNIQCM